MTPKNAQYLQQPTERLIMLRQFLVLLMIVGITSGCSMQPVVPKTPTVNETYTQIQTPQSLDNNELKALKNGWWQTFNDSSLNSLINQAIIANPDSLSAVSAIRQARAYQSQINANAYPTVSASAGMNSQYVNKTDQQTDNYSLGLDAQWEADIFNQKSNATQSATELLQATKADYADLVISLSSEVANTYFSLRQQQQILKLVQSSLQTWKETEQLVQWQATAGLESQLAVEQARRSYAQTEATIPNYQATIAQLQHQLAGLIGVNYAQLPKSLLTEQDLPTAPDIKTNQLPLEILRNRPDVKAAEYRAKSAALNQAVAQANLYPNFVLRGSLTSTAANLADMLSVNSLITSLAASLSQTLFDNGQRKSAVMIAKEQALQALLNYKKTVLSALSEVQLANTQRQNAQQYLQKTLTALELAKNEEQLALLQYQSGQIAFSEVLIAQRTRLGLQQQVLNAQQSLLKYTISFTKSTMGDWAWQQMQAASSPKSEESENE